MLATRDVDARRAVLPLVIGMAHRTGAHVVSEDPHEPVVPGSVRR